MEDFKIYLLEKLSKLPFYGSLADEFATIIMFLLLLVVAWFARYLVRHFLVRSINSMFRKTKNTFDDTLIDHEIFHKFSHFVPGLLLLYLTPLIVPTQGVLLLILAVVKIYLTFVSVITFNSVLSALHDMYKKMPMSDNIQIVGYVQVVKILVYIIGGVLVLSIVLNQSPYALLTSFGAMAAILVLVFRDIILGFVANVQLSANNMVKPGDWITVKGKADGTVLDISLTTVKVQNFDKTISMVPTSSLVQDNFVNWKGMEQGNGRRVRASITLQADTIRFVDEKLLDEVNTLQEMGEVVDNEKRLLLQQKGDRQTNLGLFRIYVAKYLLRQQQINTEMTFLIRHLANTGEGIPIEIYIFSTDKTWVGVEDFQARIMEHFYAISPRFGLAVYQKIGAHNSSTYLDQGA